MLTKRIIACLDVHAGRVVKGVQFVDLVDAGDPATQAARHAREGADEIVLLDITATHEGRQTLLDTVRRTAKELFVPFCVGGGVKSARDAEQVFTAGADKVSINSAALADPSLITEIGASFGAQAVVVGGDGLAGCLAQVLPQVEAVSDLDRVRGAVPDALGVGSGPVPAHDRHAGMLAQPGGESAGLPAG